MNASQQFLPGIPIPQERRTYAAGPEPHTAPFFVFRRDIEASMKTYVSGFRDGTAADDVFEAGRNDETEDYDEC